jgi:hypothetical protein
MGAYVSSVRDREVVVVDLTGAPKVVTRIVVQANPNRLLLNRAQSKMRTNSQRLSELPDRDEVPVFAR